jgi:hypothetical protein
VGPEQGRAAAREQDHGECDKRYECDRDRNEQVLQILDLALYRVNLRTDCRASRVLDDLAPAGEFPVTVALTVII